jgi:putative transposase
VLCAAAHNTYVRTWEGWLYLATVIDCHTKAVVGWSMAVHMRTDLICDAITMAATRVTLAPEEPLCFFAFA